MESMEFMGSFAGHSEENVPPICLVTSFERGYGSWDDTEKRCWGWYLSETAAREAVKKNAADMHETIYVYTVIEKVLPGIPSWADVIQWYQWSEDPESNSPHGPFSWKECPAPKWSEGIIGWGIG